MRRILLALLTAVAVSPLAAQAPPRDVELDSGLPPRLQNVAFEQRLDAELPLELPFRDAAGREVRLGEYFGERPVILVLAYYTCPMLCHQVLQGVVSSLSVLRFTAGDEFDVVTVSFDPRDDPESASAVRRRILQRYPRSEAGAGWHFLSGDADSIERLTETVGFRYEWDPDLGQYAHASGIVVITPQGRVARYFYGIEFAPRDVRLGLVEAAAGRIGSPVDQLLLYCYRYDPTTGRYGAVVMNILRISAVATLVGLAAMILLLRRKAPAARPAGLRGTP